MQVESVYAQLFVSVQHAEPRQHMVYSPLLYCQGDNGVAERVAYME
jgi:hypothetical protein